MTKKFFIVILTGVITAFARAVGELIYPRYCLLCHKKLLSANPEETVCSFCLGAIILNTPPFCQKCGRKIQGKYLLRNVCGGCQRRNYNFDRAWGCCSYEGNLKALLHYFKYKNNTSLDKPLSRLMIDFVQKYSLPFNHCDYITPVPLSPRKLREREFNQAELLAENFGRHLGLKLLRNNLRRIKDSPSQTDLSKDERLSNVQDVFDVASPEIIKGKVLLLFDDVFTTGATASEAAKTLKSAGAGVVFVLTLAN